MKTGTPTVLGQTHSAAASELHPALRPVLNRLGRFLAACLLLGCFTPALQAGNLGDALDAPQLVWTTGTNAPWFGQTTNTHDGAGAAQSGTTTNFWASSWLETSVTGRVTVVYWWQLSSDPGWYTYTFNTNGAWASYLYPGGANWQPGMVSFAGGSNLLRWSYMVPGSGPPNWQANAAWLDQVMVTNIAGLKPVFLSSPPSAITATEYAYSPTNLTALIVGDLPMTCQWQRNGTNLSGTYPFYNVTSPSLILYPRTEAQSGGAYRLVASNEWGMTTSSVCTVSIVPAQPFVHPDYPLDSLIAAGESYSLSVSVYGSQPASYQWCKDGAPIPDATFYYYSFSPSALADTGGYSVIVTNAFGAATSRVAQVIVSLDPPRIVTEPDPSQSEVIPGDSAYFSVDAEGPQRLSYQWRKAGSEADWGTQSELELNPVDATNTGFYYAVVANNNGAVTSRVSVLAVAPATALGLALNTPDRVVTNDAPWNQWTAEVERTNTHDGLCAARSHPIGAWGYSSFSTVVAGPTNVSFWWRISAAAQARLEISVDSLVSASISGNVAWQQQALDLPAGEHTLTWIYRKEDAGVEGQDAAWVDQFVIGSPGGGVTNGEITSFTTGGDADWFEQGTTTHDGLSAWQSGAIADDGETWLRATVTGPGTLSFWWAVDSQLNCDFLDFSVDGGIALEVISGSQPWTHLTFELAPGLHELQWRYGKDDDLASGADAAWVDEVRFVPAPTEVVITNFTTGGNAAWYLQTTNVHSPPEAWQSGAIGHSEETQLQTTVAGPGVVSFWWMVSSESCCDFLEFRLDGARQTNIAGAVPWQQQSWSLGSGSHTLEWLYFKDGSVATDLDAGWVDGVIFTPEGGGGVVTPPVIVTNPVSQVVLEYYPVLFSVAATGSSPLFYQWYYYGNPILDATNDTYFIMNAERSFQGTYSVRVSNSADQVLSNPAELEVLMRPIIGSISSLSQSAVAGSGAMFYPSVSATRPVAFQWYHDGVLLPGATNINIVFTNITPGDAGSYRLAATNAYGGALSDTAQLTVITRPVILSWPVPITRSAGQSASFSVIATGAPPLFYQWRKAGSDIPGANAATYSIPSVTTNDAATYSVVITNSYGATNAAANLAVVVPPYLLQGPSNQTVLAGSSLYMQAIAGGTPTLNYRWRRFGTNLPGATASTLRLAPASTNHAGPYDVVVSSSYGSVTSAPATVVVNPIPIGYSPAAQDVNFATSLGADQWVGASAALPDGRWLIGGAFQTVHGLPRPAIARLNADGAVDPAFTSPLPPVSSGVYALAVQADGRIVIGGLFYTANGCTNLARLNADGSLDTNFVAQVGSTSGNMNGVTCLALASGGRIVVGGRFVTINGVHRSLLGIVHANGSLDTSFVPPEIQQAYLSPVVSSVAVQPDGEVIYATNEEILGASYPRRSVFRLLANGQPDTGFVSPDIVTVDGLMYGGNSTWAMALQPNGKLLCAMESRVIRLLPNGSLDTNYAISQLIYRSGGGQGHSMVLVGGDATRDARVLVGGAFSTVNGANHCSIALLDSNGSALASYTPGTGSDNEYIRTLAIASDGRLLAGGLFNSLGGLPRLNLGFFDALGTLDLTASAGLGALGNYYGASCVASMPDGRIVIAGDFTNVNGTPVSGVARLRADASIDPTFNVGTSPDNRVLALALQSDGKVIIGGIFSNVASQARTQLARLNTDGSLDTTFNPVLGGNYVEVDALAVHASGHIVVGGSFRTVNGVARTNLARLHSDGSLDTSFNPGAGPNNLVLAVAVRTDGAVAVGGWFDQVDGAWAPGLALLDANGARLPISSYPAQRTLRLASGPDGTIYAGTASGGSSSQTLWQINLDGTLAAFVNAAGAWYGSDIVALAVQPDGRVLSLGYDKTLRRFNRDRFEDPLFPKVSINGAFSLACQPDGHILAGGNIMTVALTPGGPTVTRHGLVRFNGDAMLAGPARVTLQVSAPWPAFSFTIQGAASQPITIEASSNLQAWLPVWTTNLPPAGSAEFADPEAAAHGKRFYRALAP